MTETSNLPSHRKSNTLFIRRVKHFFNNKNSRYLEGSCSQHSRSFIFSHVRCCDPSLVCLLTLSCWKDLYVLLVLLIITGKQVYELDLQRNNNIKPEICIKINEEVQMNIHLPRFPGRLILRPPRRHRSLHHQSCKCKQILY